MGGGVVRRMIRRKPANEIAETHQIRLIIQEPGESVTGLSGWTMARFETAKR